MRIVRLPITLALVMLAAAVMVAGQTTYTPFTTSAGVGNLVPIAHIASGTCNTTTFVRGDGTCAVPSGGGDVVGPAVSVDNAIARYDGILGKTLQNSLISIDDVGDVTLADGSDFILSAVTGTKIGTATTQKIGFFNATPIAQLSATTELKDGVLAALGFMASGGAAALHLDGGTLTAGNVDMASGGLIRAGGTGAWSTTQPTNAITTYSGTAPAGTCTDCVTYYNGTDGIPRVRDEGGVISVLKELSNANTSDSVANAADTYMAGSALTIGPVQKAGTILSWRFGCTKTLAGVATPIYSVRFGTAGTTADVARLTFTGPVQTAVVDTAWISIEAVVRSISATATVAGAQDMTHLLSTTGFGNNETDTRTAVSATFDNTSTALIAGVSINPGAAGVWTCQVVTADARNLQ